MNARTAFAPTEPAVTDVAPQALDRVLQRVLLRRPELVRGALETLRRRASAEAVRRARLTLVQALREPPQP